MSVSGTDFSSVSEEQLQNVRTPHLMEEGEQGQKGGRLWAPAVVLATFAASCVAVHLVKHTCSTKAPPRTRL